MRLRNKKTGKIWRMPKFRQPTVQEDDISFFACIGEHGCSRGELFSYKSIAELNEEWEDVAEPLIKDEKTRKAVRAWAETVFEWGKWTENRIRVGYEGNDIYCFKIFDCLFEVPLSEKEKISDGEYTIAELCGEGEE